MVAEKVERATSTRARLRGLLGRTSLDGALVIEPCTSIHTFFMKFTIDALFVDSGLRVIRAIHALRPWRMTRIYPGAAMVIELPEGAVKASDTREGDALAFED